MKTLLIKNTLSSPRKAFFAYLTQRGIYDKYIKYTTEFINSHNVYDSLDNYIMRNPPDKWISRAFEWYKHGGFNYWIKYDNEWEKICREKNY